MMRGFGVFLGKELAEFLGSWKAWVLPMTVVFLAAMSPVFARVQQSLGMPEPSTVDAYLYFSSNLIQIVLMVLVIAVAGVVSAERRSGTAILMLTKPLSRMSFVLAKIVMKIAVVIVSAVAGALVCWSVAQVFFDNVLVAEFAAVVGLWVVLATMVVAVMSLFSVVLNSQAGASGAGFGLYMVLAVLTPWEPAAAYSPVGLMTLGQRILGGESVSVAWPVTTALLVAVAAALGAAALFRRQEI